MSRFSSFSLRVACLILVFLLALLPLALFVGLSPAKGAISGVYVGATQETPDPIPPCTSSGFAVDATLLTAKPTNDLIEFHRIDRSRTSDRVGYFVTRDQATSSRRWLYTYDAKAMTMISARELQSLGQTTFTNRIVGEVVDGFLYLYRVVTAGSLTCPVGQQCIYLSKFDRNGNELGSTLASGMGLVDNLDDVRPSSASSLLLINANTAGNRFYTLWSVPGGAFLGVSASQGSIGAGQLVINGDAGFQYAGFGGAALTAQKIPLNSVIPALTGSFSFFGVEVLGAIWNNPTTSQVLGESTSAGGLNAVRNYRDANLANLFSTGTYVLTDGSAVARSTFFDNVNRKVYGFRIDAGSGANNLMRTTPDTATIEQRFNCTGCTANSIPTTDFAVSNARLYNGFDSSATVAGVVRVKVCATGGPPA